MPPVASGGGDAESRLHVGEKVAIVGRFRSIALRVGGEPTSLAADVEVDDGSVLAVEADLRRIERAVDAAARGRTCAT